MKKFLIAALFAGVLTGCSDNSEEEPVEDETTEEETDDASIEDTGENNAEAEEVAEETESNLNTAAVAWKATAAEYEALYYQGFNLARTHIDAALEDPERGEDKPLAIISDLDDTLVSPLHFWQELMKDNQEFFDDDLWDQLISEYTLSETPGASEFLSYVEDNGIEVFYVSSRDQWGDEELTNEFAIEQIKQFGYPNADADHVTILMESSDKEVVQAEIEEEYDVIIKLGDNLNDFNRSFYVDTVEERKQVTEEQKDSFGTDYIIFPNPTDGHWIRAIFGESEPEDTPENRQLFFDAATGELEQ